MAGSTAPTAVDQPGAGPTRGLWQAPVFVLGVGALVAVCMTRPLLAHPDAASPLRRELIEARHILDRSDGDATQAARLAEHVLAEKEQAPDLAGEADLTLGTSLMRQAARAEGARAAELWGEGGGGEEAAEQEKVPDADRARLQYRLGIVGFHTHDDLRRVIARIKTTIDQADDPVQGYGVLTQAYLNLPDKPDLSEALAANWKLRNLPQAKEEVLAPARLLGGELELRLGHPEEARRVLEKVGPQATPDVQGRARRLCAHSFQDQNRWPEAAALWQAALADGRPTGEVLYNLGVCAQRQEQNDAAARFWEQCVQAGGAEGQAAAAALAELRLKGPNPETALDMLARVVDAVKPGGDWSNPLLDRQAAVKLFQDAGKAYLDSRHFDEAVRLAEPFGRVAGPGEAAVLRGRASGEWARARQDEARQATAAEVRKTAEDAARDLFRQAAAAYAAAAEQSPPTGQPGEYLWLSARCSWEGQDYEQAAAQLDKVLRIEVAADQSKQDWYLQRQGEGWYLLGEARRALKDADGADAAYRECITYPTTFAYRARYYLAMAAMARGNIDDAEGALELNLTLLRKDPDPEAQEKSLFAIGGLFYNRGKYLQVVERLGEALGRFPANPEATRAHYQLADSCRRLADQANLSAVADGSQSPDKIEQKRKEYRRYLANAAKEFADLAALLDTPEGQNLLTREEQVQVPFMAADCLFDQGDYHNALSAYEILAERYANRLEGLNALGGQVRCYSALNETDRMQKTLMKIDALLPTMPEAVRTQWSEWLTVARKPVSPP